jgi:hypothetical protein
MVRPGEFTGRSSARARSHRRMHVVLLHVVTFLRLEVDAEFSSVGMCAKHDGCDHTLWCLHRPEQAQLFGALLTN